MNERDPRIDPAAGDKIKGLDFVFEVISVEDDVVYLRRTGCGMRCFMCVSRQTWIGAGSMYDAEVIR